LLGAKRLKCGLLMFEELSVVIPVKKSARPFIEQFAEQMLWLLRSDAKIIVVDSGGGELLWQYSSDKPISVEVDMPTARKLGYERVQTEFTLNLDDDNVLNPNYLTQAIQLLRANAKVVAVAIDYEKLLGHLGFGTSVWRSAALKELYDWRRDNDRRCECVYMWQKVLGKGLLIETLPYRAKHLKMV